MLAQPLNLGMQAAQFNAGIAKQIMLRVGPPQCTSQAQRQWLFGAHAGSPMALVMAASICAQVLLP